MSDAGPRTAFRVDGAEYGGGRITSTYAEVDSVGFTADADGVARLLPPPALHPLRLGNGRTPVMLEVADCNLRIGQLPPIRYGWVYLTAIVTHGAVPAPPVLPALGLLLPVVGDPLVRRYGTGYLTLASTVTNRVAAEITRVLFGEVSTVGEIRLEQDPDWLHWVAGDQDDQTLSLHIRSGGLTSTASETPLMYSARGSDLLRQSLSYSVRQSLRLGPSSARLDLGHHAWAALARDLGLSARPWGSVTWSDATETRDRLDRIGPADRTPAPPTGTEPVQAPFVIRTADGTEEQVDQGLDRMPFNPAGDFQPATD